MNASVDEIPIRYARDGYVFPLDVLTEEDAGDNLARLDTVVEQLGGPTHLILLRKPHLVLSWVDELIRHPRLIAAVSQILGPDLLCWSSTFFIKKPRDPAYVSWHQDATYWGLSDDTMLTAWLALTPSRRENGCLRLASGSQLWPIMPHVDKDSASNLLSRGQEIAVDVNEDQAIDVELSPGQASLHHVNIAHGSEPNTSDIPRVGLAIRYMPTSLRQTGSFRDSASLVAGSDAFGHFDTERRPVSDFDPNAVAYHSDLLESRRI